MGIYTITFSDGRHVTVEADTAETARSRAYRIERALPIASIELAPETVTLTKPGQSDTVVRVLPHAPGFVTWYDPQTGTDMHPRSWEAAGYRAAA